MKLILDTHVLLWALAEPERLEARRRQMLEDRSNSVYASAVSVAEVAIKTSIGKLECHVDLLATVEKVGFEWLSLAAVEADLLRTLPFHHRDPFDRMLIAQAIHNGMAIMTDDQTFKRYECSVI